MNNRVVVTGIGAICALGNCVSEVWRNLLLVKDIVEKPDNFDTTNFRSNRSTVISKRVVNSLDNPHLHDAARFGVHAALEALHSSELSPELYHKSGLSMGTTSGGMMDSFSDAFHYGKEDYWSNPNNAPVHSSMTSIARHLCLRGPAYNFSMACISSSYAILNAAELIRNGENELMLAGGCDRVRRADFAGFNSLRSISPDLCRPFDRDRKGLIMGDGAAFLLLESYEHAKQRRAKILAELVGEGHTSDAYHVTAPDPDGITRAMRQALSHAGISPNTIDYINCHGTGTELNDKAEIDAIKKIFGKNASNIHTGSTKSVTGHLLGTAGAIEALFSVLSIKYQTAPPSANCINLDPEISFRFVGNQPIHTRIGHAMSNSLGFGGNNTSLIFSAAKH